MRLQEEPLLLEVQTATDRTAGQPDDAYTRQRRWFGKFDRHLDAPPPQAPAHLCKTPALAGVQQALHRHQTPGACALPTYCVVPNHGHLLGALCSDAMPPPHHGPAGGVWGRSGGGG